MSYYVTTPIYYVNGEPHLGHAYTTIAADVLARHMRQRGEDVFFLTGTDEHGEPVAQAAERLGHHAARARRQNAIRFKELAARVNATNDFFIRTTDPEHMAKVAEVVQRIHDNGHVYAGHYEGWYCPRCADFKTESRARGRQSLPDPQDRARDREGGQLVLPAVGLPGAARAALRRPPRLRHPAEPLQRGALVHQGRPARRLAQPARLKWGVPVPWDESQVVYVWIDALLNYYTALSYAREGEDLTDRFWPATRPPDRQGHPQVPRRHLAGAADGGRDRGAAAGHHPRLPTARRAQDVEVARQRDRAVPGGRTSTAPDALRFYVLREVSFGSDGEVSPEGFETRYTTELANEYGNLASRTLAMIDRYRDGVVPDAEPPAELARDFDGLAEAVRDADRRGGADRRARRDLAARSSGSTATCRTRSRGSSSKDDAEAEHLDQVLYALAEGLRVVSVLLHAFMPGSAERLLAALGRRGALARRARASARWRAAPRSASSASSSRGSRPRRRPPEAPAVIDTHCHLDSLRATGRRARRAARARRASRGWRPWG